MDQHGALLFHRGQEVYGSGSKIYHNVVGRLGIMSGPQSDLRTGLAWQTVMNGRGPTTSRCGC